MSSYSSALRSARAAARQKRSPVYIHPMLGAWRQTMAPPALPYVKVHPDERAIRHEQAVGDPRLGRSKRAAKKIASHGIPSRDGTYQKLYEAAGLFIHESWSAPARQAFEKAMRAAIRAKGVRAVRQYLTSRFGKKYLAATLMPVGGKKKKR